MLCLLGLQVWQPHPLNSVRKCPHLPSLKRPGLCIHGSALRVTLLSLHPVYVSLHMLPTGDSLQFERYRETESQVMEKIVP